jgi:hypothetical protein
MAKRLIKFRNTNDYAIVDPRKGKKSENDKSIAWASCEIKMIFQESITTPNIGVDVTGTLGVFEWLIVFPGLGILMILALPVSLAGTAGVTVAAILGSLAAPVITLIVSAAAALGITVTEYISRFAQIFLPGTTLPEMTEFPMPCPYDDTPITGNH